MSQRVKKPGRSADDSQGKRRRRRPSGSDADEDGTRSGSNSGGNGSLTGMWTPRHLNDLKVSSIYNRNSAEAPAELYRKDLISAMKLPDSEPLTPEEYWLITDSWKQEWEKGVQVPVNPESLPEPEVKLIQPVADRSHDFRLPKKKYVRVTHDDFFNPDYHQLVSTAARAEKVCSYDLDDVDAAWLGCSNADRAMQNTPLISEFLMEQVIEELELQCWEQVQTILKSQEGLGIEYDENVICDVCRSPESEEGNEMVFCDSCNICVHQACYGITTIPSGSWLCKTCTLGIKPPCVLCPNVGGAMKATRSGHTWAHVACAIWIPEVSIGSVEKMEPITKISSIPQSRWSLICVLCKEKTGACIQCSVKTCKTAYHVTCAFKNGLEMKPIIVDENAEDGIKLRSYCQKHSVNNTKKDKSEKTDKSGSEDDAEKKKLKAMTAEERNQARAEKLQQIEAEFYKYVRLKDVSQNLAVDMDVVILIYNYWKLKRKSLNNRPLVPPRPETTQLLTQQQEQDLEQMKMFVQLRQDLERVRNLCYMVSRREKLSRSFFRLKEQTFQKQLAILSENDLSPEERQAVLSANSGPSIYDQFYSSSTNASTSAAGSSSAQKSSIPDYDTLISLIMGGVDAKKDLVNGVIKANKKNSKQGTPAGSSGAAAAVADAVNSALSNSTATNSSGNNSASVNSSLNVEKAGPNPYKKQFVNGARRRNLLGSGSSRSCSEAEDVVAATDDKAPAAARKNKKKVSATGAAATTQPKDGTQNKTGNRKPLSYLFDSDSSLDIKTEGVSATDTASQNKKSATKATKGKGKIKTPAKGSTGIKSKSYFTDSDELELPVTSGKTAANNTTKGKDTTIYTESEDSEAENLKSNVVSTKKTEKSAPKDKAPKKGKASATSTKGNLDNQKSKLQPNEESPVTDKKQKKSTKDKTESSETSPQLNQKSKVKAGVTKKGRNKAGFDPAIELIVPQRQAAKKATESIRSVKQKAKDQQQPNPDGSVTSLSASGLTGSKEDISSTKETRSRTISKAIVSTLSESEDDEEKGSTNDKVSTKRAKSDERKLTSGKAPKKAGNSAQLNTPAASTQDEDETGDMDEFDFDLDKDGNSSKNVNYVPQRQAAKKAAEHIRSGLSNVVAARLIIEDEMELSRKKLKGEKGQAATPSLKKTDEDTEESQTNAAEGSKIESASAEGAKKATSKDRTPSRGPVKVGKGGKKESPSTLGQQSTGAGANSKAAMSKEARGLQDTSDWPFLDKGSQSACRRSRERTSSSSSSGSSGSSSSSSSCSSRSSSASSSRSSSAESASPEPRNLDVKKASKQQPQVATAVANKLSVNTKETGPGRKLKTSERAQNSRTKLRAETTSREKPTPKGGRPAKSGPGRGDPFRSAFSPSPEPEPKPTSTATSKQQQREQPDKHVSPTNNNKVSPLSKTNEQQQREQRRSNKSESRSPSRKNISESPETKGRRRKGEPPSTKRTQAEKDQKSEQIPVNTPEKGQTSKALARRKSPIKHTGPCLSSESDIETDSHAVNQSKAEISKAHQQLNSASPAQRKRKSNSEGGVSLGLSESEESGAEEKENSCITSLSSEQHNRDVADSHLSSSSVLPPKTSQKTSSQKNTTPTAASQSGSILSPLTPTENKEKEPSNLPKAADSEQPEIKRPRLDSITVASTSSSGHLKSFFSPPGSTGGGRDGEILDFDSELYDLARSVVTDEYHGDEMNSSGSLSFSFSQELFSREDNKEDSARATLNLVEKLRLQHARKSGTGTHRPSTESSSDTPCDNLLDEIPGRSPSRPGSSLQDDEKKVDVSGESIGSVEPVVALEIRAEDKSAPSYSHTQSTQHENNHLTTIKSPTPLLQSTISPDRTKLSIQGDERWVPPSGVVGPPSRHTPTHGGVPPPHAASHPIVSPRNSSSYTSIPEISPPVSKQLPTPGSQKSQQLHIPGTDEEAGTDKHRLRSPSSSYHDLISSHSHLHGSHSSLSMESSDKGNSLSVDTHPSSPAVSCSPLVSPIIPGLQQARGSNAIIPPTVQAGAAAAAAALAAAAAGMAAAEASPNLSAAASGLPFGANPFMYPHLANNPALASMVSSLAAAAGSPNPLAFLQVPLPKGSPGALGPLSPGSFPFPSVLQQNHQQGNITGQGTVRTPTMSPNMAIHSKQRRPSDVVSMGDGKMPLNSPLVSVATSMPPLAKPPLTSPSVLLTSHTKTVTNPVPLSAVAHIIESVVNNHTTTSSSISSAGASLPKTTLSLDMQMPLATTPAGLSSASTVSSIKTPLTSPAVTATPPAKQAQGPTASGNDTGISAILSNKTTENIIAGATSKASRETPGSNTNTDSSNLVVPTIAPNSASPKAGPGRGRRGAAAKAVEKLSGVNAVIEDMMMSPQQKPRGRKGASQSPGRGKPPATPARRGRGKGRGKNVMVRKDLAGTVYDIDFDEFEENAQEKIDLRALRERRKSSDIHSSNASEEKATKHSSKHSSDQPPILLTLSVPHSDKHSRRAEKKKKQEEKQEAKEQQQLTVPPISIKVDVSRKTLMSSTVGSGKSERNKSNKNSENGSGIHSILQAPLPGPVDMRTYSATSATTNVAGEESLIGKIGFPAAKDPSSEIASLFMSTSELSGGAGTSTTVNDLEELDKALEVLASTPKQASSGSANDNSANEPSLLPNAIASAVAVGGTSSATLQDNVVKDAISISDPNSHANKLQSNTQSSSAAILNNAIPYSSEKGAGVSFEQIASKQLDIASRDVNSSFNKISSDFPSSTSSENTSDMSRNQLKFKIKGPFLDANYSSTNSMHPGGVPDNSHHHHPLHQQTSGTGMVPGNGPPIYPQSTHVGSYGAQDTATYPPGHPHHQQQWMMSSMMSNSNTSNLRRMRKKELLRQYWTQDMNMDGGSNLGFPPGAGGSGGMSDMSHLPPNQGSHPHHPLSRSVITIPKAVASMSIIPTKEDYRLDNPEGNDSNDSNDPNSQMADLWSGNPGTGLMGSKSIMGGGKNEGTQKKRRRGIYREMAALGILPPDPTPKERRRDRNATTSNSGGNTPDANSRKRARNNNKPSRSTFIPPTLVESQDSPGPTKGDSAGAAGGGTGASSSISSNKSNNSGSQSVSASLVHHPTPKLKIKFGDLSNASSNTSGSSSNQPVNANLAAALSNSTNHMSDSDKETPNKKAKGRPPKKRVLPDAASSSSSMSASSTAGFSMEELKRESMKYREMIMKDYAKKEQQEILKLSGTRRSKKHKRKAASGAGSETDDGSVRSKSPEVKVIDGPKPKLIFRFGKSRGGKGNAGSGSSDAGSTIGAGGSADNGVVSSGETGTGGKVNENGLPENRGDDENSNTVDGDMQIVQGCSSGELNDVSSRNYSQNGNKEKALPPNNNNNGSNGEKVLVLELESKGSNKIVNSCSTLNNQKQQDVPSTKGKNNNPPSESSSSSTSSASATVPIRLKLSRCYEGYSLKNKDGLGGKLGDVVERENCGASTAAKQSDSCQVR